MRMLSVHFSLSPDLLISLDIAYWVEFTVALQTFILLSIDLDLKR